MDVHFEIRPQVRQIRGRGNRVSIAAYTEDGRHFGAVGIMADDPQRGPVVTISKPVSPDGLLAIAHQLVEYAKGWPVPAASTPPAMEDPPEPEAGD